MCATAARVSASEQIMRVCISPLKLTLYERTNDRLANALPSRVSLIAGFALKQNRRIGERLSRASIARVFYAGKEKSICHARMKNRVSYESAESFYRR